MNPGDRQRLLTDVAALRLPRARWDQVEAALSDVATGRPGADDALAQLVFELRVQRRFHGTRGAAPGVVPTKQTSVLPWVGLVCGALVLGMGASLGGGAVFVAVALLALFVFAVAFSGSRIAHRGPAAGATAAPEEAPTPPPAPVAARLRELAAEG